MNSGCENILRADLVKSETLPIFVMRQSEKVSAGAPGVPDATANARKRVESILKLSNEEIANTLSNLTHEQYESIAPFFRVVFCLIECWQGDKSSNPEKSKAL